MSKFDPTRFKVLRRSPAGKISVKELNNGAVQAELGVGGSMKSAVCGPTRISRPPDGRRRREGTSRGH